MSFNNDGFNQSTTTTGRNERFSDSPGGVESHRQGTGTGAFDSANTGLSSYGGQSENQPQRVSQDQTFRAASNFDTSPDRGQGQGQTQGSQRAFGGDRSTEKPGFTGSESAYDKTATGGAFAQRSSSGVGQTDEFGGGNTPSIPGTRASGAASGGRFDNATDDERDNQQWDTSRNDDQFGGERQTGKPTFGDKMRGNVEKLAGSVTGKQNLKERGQERKTGEF